MNSPKVTNQELRDVLIHYLQLYLSKDKLKMKSVVISILNSLTSKKNISYKQFQAIIKFIEREPTFKSYKRHQIIELFSPILNDLKRNNTLENSPNTLHPFLK